MCDDQRVGAYRDPETALCHAAAARFGVPVARCRAVANEHGGHAYGIAAAEWPAVLSGLAEFTPSASRRAGTVLTGSWACGTSRLGNLTGAGWSVIDMADDDRREGVVFLAETAPSGAKAVVVSWEGREHIIPVRDGLVLFAAWGVPYANASADPALEAALAEHLRRISPTGDADGAEFDPADTELARLESAVFHSIPTPRIVRTLR